MQASPVILAGLLALAPLAAPAEAQPVRATYDVYAAGMTILQFEAIFDISPQGYRVETRLRTRGIAATFVPGEQTSRAIGTWRGDAARPSSFRAEGVGRGRPRLIDLGWEGGNPVVQALVPPNDEEREPVPEAQRLGTIDSLSAMALLSRAVATTGSCEGQAPVFDGRRRSEFISRNGGQEVIRPWRTAWHGQALRCGFEGRLVSGFMRDQRRDQAAAPQRGTAWIASPYAGAPPIPVRIEMESRWFGSATAVLLTAESSTVAQRGQ